MFPYGIPYSIRPSRIIIHGFHAFSCGILHFRMSCTDQLIEPRRQRSGRSVRASERRSIRKGLVPASGYLLCMIFDLCTVEVIGMVFGAKPVNTLCTHMVLNPFGCKRRQLLLFPI